MSILSISRNFNGDPNIVTIVSDDSLVDMITTGYWELPETVDSVAALQNGVWEWSNTDIVLINYSLNLNGFFTFDSVNGCFAINTPNQEPIPFVPTITFVTPGDLSVVYTRQIGLYWKVGNLIFMRARTSFTPTYTTASGEFRIVRPDLANVVNATVGGSITVESALTFPAGTTQVFPVSYSDVDQIGLRGIGTGVVTNLSTTQFPSGVAQDFTVYVTFQV